jgi:hypothetical protein
MIGTDATIVIVERIAYGVTWVSPPCDGAAVKSTERLLAFENYSVFCNSYCSVLKCS